MSSINTQLAGLGAIKTFTKKEKVQVNKLYWGTNEMFEGLFQCQVEKIYKNSAVVRIMFCQNPEDDQTQYALDDKTVVSLKSLTRVKRTA